MICPKCHNDNKFDNLTCDFCMHELPMSEERKKEIIDIKKKQKKEHWKNTLTKLLGLLFGVFAFIAVIVIVYLMRK